MDMEIMVIDKDRLESMRNMLRIQGMQGNWDCDEYMLGLYNGMEMMMSMIEGRESNYRSFSDSVLDYEEDEFVPFVESSPKLNSSDNVSEYEDEEEEYTVINPLSQGGKNVSYSNSTLSAKDIIKRVKDSREGRW